MKKKNSKKKQRFGALNALLVMLVVAFGIGYLVQANALAVKGYEIRELENQIYALELEKSELDSQSLELQSMTTVKNKVQQLNMVAIGDAEYLGPRPVAIAR